jgi:predicted nuclease of predicted toxin-antitoxin system
MAGRIKLYTDEHVSRAVIKGLRERGVDVLSVPEAGLIGAPDEEHLALAAREFRVLFTQDDDFLVLASEGARHAGIVYARQGTSVGQVIHGLMLICQVMEPDEMVGHIEFL